MRMLISLPLVAIGLAVAGATAGSEIQPGKWQGEGTIVEVDAPDMPPGVANMMKGSPTKFDYCVTPEQAADSPKAMFDQTGGKCSYDSFAMTGGKLDAKATCKHDMGTMKMHMTGTYTKTSYAAKNRMTIASPMGSMTMIADVKGKRIGAC
ncbi:DUF3617 domain-containing protein [Sphingomicrobium nitratireducens]|uniref:DUF3617 domain-containing protein n=1 Tax=Sphingomicrobium nitratireducens TaxID=2964666 RepID=UPI00223FEF1F|nr:DUF3617 domain-containing protein [Sphingomicrobium nitratireducens]